jgi:hypothetical protein
MSFDSNQGSADQAFGPAEETPSRVAWSRVGFVFLWVLAFGLVASSVASSWESLVGRLARAPRSEAR